MRLRDLVVLFDQIDELLIVLVQDVHLFLAEVLDIDQVVARSFDGGHEFVELELDSQGILVCAR